MGCAESDSPGAATSDADVTLQGLLEEMTDLERLTRLPSPAYRTYLASSRDRDTVAPDQPDWFSNYDGGSWNEVIGDEKVMMEVEGPGVITRIWSANPSGTWRFYIDGAEEPALEMPLGRITGGEMEGVDDSLAYVEARGHTVLLPIPFARSIRVTTDGEFQFYHFNYRRYADGTEVQPFSLDALEAAGCTEDTCHALGDPGDRGSAAEGEVVRASGAEAEATLTAGPSGGAIRGLQVRLDDRSAEALRETVLAITFDGTETVRVPVGDFFGSGPGLNPIESLPVTTRSDGTLVSRWVMPFQNEARVELVGGSGDLEVTHGDYEWDERAMYFHARWRPPTALSTERLHDWELVSLEGQGAYVGTVLNVHNPVEKWWGEGDERIRVDDGPWTEWLGTGTEDYFGYAWCSTELFDRPFHGQPRADGPVNSGRVSNYRWHTLDAIQFGERLEFILEIHHWQKADEAVTMTYDAVLVWYARPGVTHSLPSFDRGSIPNLAAANR